ncbi:hypothetical protein A584_20093 [Pseudomonas syringae pv. theae ICMP 3923]|uniref:Imm5 family immunity protein n=1 Tax=Pseudomonas syringae TaxID=317 RepID=UPI000357CCFE|nr:Imm5 family immunity protein [Pseudomonas syringae]EPM67873.1 hypothetical protein A584_20093 [Pseudomonas syringae pv. theae ICMP 3923]KPZ33623.1 hypothetical protein AN901_202537 [Pseudomonas syringae pv. theae]MBL3871368.1 immunity protein Imm5 [Pseudomonas syringae pv. theae]GKQ31748.1 immunity protein Imm5 [Pseudomonas syringae pv. theae]
MNSKSELVIKKLLAEVATSQEGDLALPLRKLLWNTITDGETPAKTRIILTELDVLCVKQGLDFWKKKFGDAKDLDYILNIALEAAHETFDEEKANSIRDRFYVSIVEDQQYEPEEYPAMFVGHAAANAILTATVDFQFDPDDHDKDCDSDPEAFESSYLIASAFAGGLDRKGNPKLRRNFWEWYLTIAVPKVV